MRANEVEREREREREEEEEEEEEEERRRERGGGVTRATQHVIKVAQFNCCTGFLYKTVHKIGCSYVSISTTFYAQIERGGSIGFFSRFVQVLTYT